MHQLSVNSDEILFVLALAITCASVVVAWRRLSKLALQRWRRLVLKWGLLGNTASLVLLLGLLLFIFLLKGGTSEHTGLPWFFSSLFWVALSVATVVCGAFGRGAPRFLVVTSGILLTALWYVVGLANSL